MSATRDERSLGDLFAELTRETGTLVRQEVQLAGAEMGQKATAAAGHVASLVLGGAVAYAGLLALVAAAVIGLEAAGLPWWLSALVVGLVLAGVGYALVQRARTALKRADVVPRKTLDTLREDREWAKDQAK